MIREFHPIYDTVWMFGILAAIPLIWIGGYVALASYGAGVLMVLGAMLSSKSGGSVGYIEMDH